MWFLKSTIFLPLEFFIYASLMFHSLGIFQSNTFVPEGTSCISKGIFSLIIYKVCLTPFPVILLHMGNNFFINSYIKFPSIPNNIRLKTYSFNIYDVLELFYHVEKFSLYSSS